MVKRWKEPEVYVLKDDGASEDFVSTKFVERMQKKGAVVEERTVGRMRVRTADNKNPASMERSMIHLKLKIGTYYYHSWFTIYDLADYDIILGKNWMTHINLRHQINHKTNIMWIWNELQEDGEIDPQVHTLVGLSPDMGRTGTRE